jgi:hypothetical protein
MTLRIIRTSPQRQFCWKFYVCSAMLFVGWKTAKRIEERGFGDSEIEVTEAPKSGVLQADSAT